NYRSKVDCWYLKWGGYYSRFRKRLPMVTVVNNHYLEPKKRFKINSPYNTQSKKEIDSAYFWGAMLQSSKVLFFAL
ncbi:MAG: hypothetical protein MJK04_28755, partial [Psychrosphaera sp.]|nr:hypothetical protein [Psychrosphaera sp.]